MFKAVSMALVMGAALVACTPAQQAAPSDDLPIIKDGEGRQCVMEDWQSWVGKNRQSLPAAPEGMTFRVLCKECAATMDYRENRVTFSYDDNNIITRVACG